MCKNRLPRSTGFQIPWNGVVVGDCFLVSKSPIAPTPPNYGGLWERFNVYAIYQVRSLNLSKGRFPCTFPRTLSSPKDVSKCKWKKDHNYTKIFSSTFLSHPSVPSAFTKVQLETQGAVKK